MEKGDGRRHWGLCERLPCAIGANVGIAMGRAARMWRASRDMVLLTMTSHQLEGLRLGRATYDGLRKFVYYVYT
jgi:magnesium-transporting ATPase (P-type)